MKKLIGITGPSSFSSNMNEMVEELYRANFVLIHHNNADSLNEWVGKIDGLILAGGVDIHPAVYADCILNDHGFSKFDIARDAREIKLLNACISNKVPVLGVCRGHQLIGVSLGMRLIPDLSDSVIAHTPSKAGVTLSAEEPCHRVRVISEKIEYYQQTYKVQIGEEEEMRAFAQIPNRSKDEFFVNSYHHQALFCPKRPDTLTEATVIATARVGLKECEQIIEFMEFPGGISVQWHPEADWQHNTHSRAVLQRFYQLVCERVR